MPPPGARIAAKRAEVERAHDQLVARYEAALAKQVAEELRDADGADDDAGQDWASDDPDALVTDDLGGHGEAGGVDRAP